MWLVNDTYKRRMSEAQSAGRVPTAEQQATHRAAVAAKLEASGKPENYVVAGNVARINVHGVLTAQPDLWAWFLDLPNTTYSDIATSVSLAENDPSVTEIVYDIESGGGTVDGLVDALATIDAGKKPARVESGLAASAGYWIASRAAAGSGKIIAKHELAEFGSIGVAVRMLKREDVFDIASTNAPNKRPDPSTEEGQAVIRGELDAVHDLFVKDVAEARGVDVEKVNSDFGQGGVFLAKEAKRRGMIDGVKSRPKAHRLTGGNPAASNNKADGEIAGADNRGKKMDINQLKSQHPDLYAAVRQEGFDAGVKQERIRVDAHLTLGEASGEMAYAINCTRDGSDVTAVVNAKHFAAVMKGREISAREEDDKSVKAATGDASAVDASEGDALGAQVVAIMRAKRAGGEAA